MARLFLEPTELLLVIGLVLLGVQARQPCRDRLPLLLPLAWSLGGLCGLTLPSELLLALPCTALVAVVGLLVVLEVRLRPVVLLPLAAALALAEQLAGFPQATMNADRMSAYQQWDLPLHHALHQEWLRGKECIGLGLLGAGRFADGEGRHGDFGA
jgi:hypothetical protein